MIIGSFIPGTGICSPTDVCNFQSKVAFSTLLSSFEHHMFCAVSPASGCAVFQIGAYLNPGIADCNRRSMVRSD